MKTLPKITGIHIPLRYAEDYDTYPEIRSEQALIIIIARDRSPKWREFLAHGPIMRAKWFNEIVDWLVETYPTEFQMVKQ